MTTAEKTDIAKCEKELGEWKYIPDYNTNAIYERFRINHKGKSPFRKSNGYWTLTEHFVNWSKQQEQEQEISKKQISEELITPEESEKIQNWLNQSQEERWKYIKEILDYFIISEDSNKALTYFFILGNWFNVRRHHIGFRGDSSGGKTFVLMQEHKLFPKGSLYVINNATVASIKNDAEVINKAKAIIIPEITKDTPLREILKAIVEGSIIFKTSVHDENMNFETETTEIYEKSVFYTFSFESIQIDLINRSLILTPDQTKDQTNKIIDSCVEREINKPDSLENERKIMEKCDFHAKTLDYYDTTLIPVIPYMNEISSFLKGDSDLNVRRFKDIIMDLIRIITLWNQHKREIVEIKGVKYVISEYDDLKLALEIGQEIFKYNIRHTDIIKESILGYLPKKPKDLKDLATEDKINTNTKIYAKLNEDGKKISKNTVRNKLSDMTEEGFINFVKGKNKTNFYYKIKEKQPFDDVKITPDTVQTRINEFKAKYNIDTNEAIDNDKTKKENIDKILSKLDDLHPNEDINSKPKKVDIFTEMEELGKKEKEKHKKGGEK